MKTLNIKWLNHCAKCQNNDYAIVQTEKGNQKWLYDNDVTECPDCGNSGVIQTEDGCAWVAWDKEPA